METSYGRICSNAIKFLRKALKLFSNKPKVIVARCPSYPWALESMSIRGLGCRIMLKDSPDHLRREQQYSTTSYAPATIYIE